MFKETFCALLAQRLLQQWIIYPEDCKPPGLLHALFDKSEKLKGRKDWGTETVPSGLSGAVRCYRLRSDLFKPGAWSRYCTYSPVPSMLINGFFQTAHDLITKIN